MIVITFHTFVDERDISYLCRSLVLSGDPLGDEYFHIVWYDPCDNSFYERDLPLYEYEIKSIMRLEDK